MPFMDKGFSGLSPLQEQRLAYQFQQEYQAMCAQLDTMAIVPPSVEVIVETARRHPTATVFHVVAYWRAHWKAPSGA